MNILDFTDINSYFEEEETFYFTCYRNDTGRIICFEDVRGGREITVRDFYYCDPETGEPAELTYKEALPGKKTYILKIGGYIVVDNEELSQIILSNPVLKKLLNSGTLVKCPVEEAKTYDKTEHEHGVEWGRPDCKIDRL